MQLFRRTSGGETKESPLRQAGGDAVQVLVDYVKQETLDPVKGLGRFVAMGVAGSLLLALGLLLLLIALLRVLQTETGTTFTGNLSWVPYGCVAVVAMVGMALAAWRITRGAGARHSPDPEQGGS